MSLTAGYFYFNPFNLKLKKNIVEIDFDYFDYGEVMCPSKRFLDLECLGCGITRGIQHAMHFEFETAWYFNKLTFIVLPVAIVYWIYLLKKELKQIKNLNIKKGM